MKRWGLFLVFVWGCYLISPTLPPAAANAPSVVINELAWAGSSMSSSDEWIELYNTGLEPVDISGWILTKNTSGTDTVMVTLPANSQISAEGYFVVAHFAMENSGLNVAPNFVTAGLTLSNSALLIKLFKGPISDATNLVDTAGTGGTPPAGSNTAKTSMERDGDLMGWHDATIAVNLDTGIIDLATPKAGNSELVLPPTLTSVNPSSGQIDDTLHLQEIRGTNFSITPTPEVSIERNGQTVVATNVTGDSTDLISSADINTQGLSAGKWKLIVTNPGGLSAELTEAIELTAPPPPQDLATTVRINEVYPRPNTTSNDEYVELYNSGDKAVNLLGWIVDDTPSGGSAPFTFESRNIPARGFVTIYKPESHLTLNDSGDMVRLIQPNGFQLDSTNYSDASSGSTWARFDDGFKWTISPTPAKSNIFSELTMVDPPAPHYEEAEDPVATPKSYEVGTVIINEVYPNPKIGDEFIELRNTGNVPLDLTDWKLQDEAGRSYVIKSEAIQVQSLLTPNSYVVINSNLSHIPLNNTGGEKLKLFDPSGKLISQMEYPDKAPVDAAYAWDGTNWWWTPTVTPGKENQLEVAEIQGAVAGDITLPITLPVTGNSGRRALGILLVGYALVTMISLYRKQHDSRNHYFQPRGDAEASH